MLLLCWKSRGRGTQGNGKPCLLKRPRISQAIGTIRRRCTISPFNVEVAVRECADGLRNPASIVTCAEAAENTICRKLICMILSFSSY